MDDTRLNNVNKGNKRKMVLSAILVCTVLLLVLSVTYAFMPRPDDNNKNQDTVASTATLKLSYTDCASNKKADCANITASLKPGESVEKTFEITNVGTMPSVYNILFRELANTFVNDELVYTLENLTTGTVIKSSTTLPNGTYTDYAIQTGISSSVGETTRYKLKVTFLNKNYDQAVNSNAEFSFKLKITDNANNPIDKIIASSRGTRTNFDDPALSDEGIYEMADDYGTSYYYRGAVTDNYVKFGQNKSGQDMYWRIIRINGDGSLRIMYTGTNAYPNGTNNSDMFIKTDQPWNSAIDDAKYVGWMYGGAKGEESTSKEIAQTNTTDSDIKTFVDNWYKENIVETGYSGVVADVLFCNDRTTPGSSATGWADDTGLGYGKNYTGYASTARTRAFSISTPTSPTFKCLEKNDAFTVNDTIKGNGDLTYPVGLITADEIVAAGSGKYYTNNDKYYLYRPSNMYWSLSPSVMYTERAFVMYVDTTGYLNQYHVSGGGAVAPIINLNADFVKTLRGTGTVEDPYRAS